MKPKCKAEAAWLFWRREQKAIGKTTNKDKFVKYAKKMIIKARRRFFKLKDQLGEENTYL